MLTAQPKDDRTDSWIPRATQWFVVSDIGLSTYTGQDGLNVFARSLGTAKPIADADLTLLAKNNEILGTAKTDAEGRATFNPGLTRGEGGMAPAVLMASSGDEDFVFLDMTKAGFDLSDRGVTGREAPGALDVYAWTERGIYRAGETVHVAALARDGAADAVENLPLTFIFSRPDGVEDRRIVSDGASAGGHAVDLGLSSAAMRGTWTVAIHTDPKEPAVASQAFLVEDFVPDRIEFDLTADKPEIARRRNRQRHRRRPLPLWRAGRRPCARRRSHADHQAPVGQLQGLLLRPRRRAGGRSEPHAADRPAAASATTARRSSPSPSTSCRRRRGCSTPPSRCACARPAAAPSSARSTSPCARPPT